VPGPATGLADVGVADPQPLEPTGVGEHPSQQLAVVALHPGPLGQRQPGAGDAIGEVVADPLQLAEAEDPGRRGAGGDVGLDLDPAEGLGD
jgi:hypothetical protein